MAVNHFSNQESVKLWHSPELGGVEMMRANFVTQTFPRHTHEGFGVGVIERGALEFYYRGENVVAPPGIINLVNPDEVHTGQAATEIGWTYRMFYFSADVIQQAASELSGRQENIPFFQAGVIHDDELANQIYALHRALEDPQLTALEKQSRFLIVLAQLIKRHADHPPAVKSFGREHRCVARIKEYIAAHYQQNITIQELASVANLSPFHFIRVFRNHVGLPPHAYLKQYRINRAKTLLNRGLKIADAAADTGFVDQSHLSRHFKRIMGFTPGQYSNFVQDA